MNLAAISFSDPEIQEKNKRIRERALFRSKTLDGENFTRTCGDDIKIMFEEIDQEYFGGALGRLEASKSCKPMIFRFSKTATRSGGMTFRHRKRSFLHKLLSQYHYEISISARLIFINFNGDGRAITIGGRPCATRLEAMQRIMEHEMMHLWEFLLFGNSSCKASRFKTLILRIFGHTESAHRLATPAEHAMETHQIRVGQMVEFDFEGVKQVGMVNRINQRATVLVESANGQPYRNGKRYLKYYIPLEWLRGMPNA